MIGSVIFTVLVGLAYVQPKTININEIVDLKLELANRLAVTANRTCVDYGKGFLSTIAYEGAVGIGLDSLYRTGDCEMRFNGNSITYIYRIGQKILATFFRKLTYKDLSGSGYYRARNNSIEYSYTVSYPGASCNVRLEALKLDLESVEAYLHDKSWDTDDDAEFSTLVQGHLLNDFNSKLQGKSQQIEESLETIFCQRQSSGEKPTQGLDVLRKFLFE